MSATMIAITLTKGLISLPMDIILHNDYFLSIPRICRNRSLFPGLAEEVVFGFGLVLACAAEMLPLVGKNLIVVERQNLLTLAANCSTLNTLPRSIWSLRYSRSKR